MLCGAKDVDVLLPIFQEVASELDFTPLSFLDGTISYHNYGYNRWEENSRLTVQSADILLFVIHKSFGSLTWDVEYDEAIKNGKNIIVLCSANTYTLYRNLRETLSSIPPDTDQNTKNLVALLQRLEDGQLTIVTYELNSLKQTIKKQLLNLFIFGLRLTEEHNRRNAFLPIIKSHKYKSLFANYKGDLYEEIARNILFDYFENKELRKRALDYFVIRKTLTEDEILELCMDLEQGVARKTLVLLSELTSESINLPRLFRVIIDNSSEDDVGYIRRAINAFFEIDVKLAVKALQKLFPCQDVGTPRRIVNQLKNQEEFINREIVQDKEFQDDVLNLLQLCLDFKSEDKGWREIGNQMLTFVTGAN
jgi:hypothetical protein